MIKPVTYQGLFNFKSNLYALEVKSRFIDQQHADGYYKNYGNELNATAVNNVISVGTGAFVIQGRMHEIAGGETVEVAIENGKVGYLCARIETYHPSDEDNCSFVVKTGASLSAIALTQQDTYAAASETTNRVYECPIYSFTMTDGQITNLTKVLPAVADYNTVKQIADEAFAKATTALNTSNSASSNAILATQVANSAKAQAETANVESQEALTTAQEALNRVVETAGGTVVTKDGVAMATLSLDVLARLMSYAFTCQTAEFAEGYTLGGGIYKKFEEIEKRLNTLENN